MNSRAPLRKKRTPTNRIVQERDSAFTLLEIVLALAVLGGALAVIGECIDVAGRNAATAQAFARAQLLAASVMDELIAGSMERADVADQQLDVVDSIPWTMDVTVGSADELGVYPIEVRVRQDLDPNMRPARFRLVRSFGPPEVESASDSSQGDDAGAAQGSAGASSGGAEGGL